MLKELPQVTAKTGISGDYLNEYAVKVILFREYVKGNGKRFLKFIEAPVKKYTERYPLDAYNYPVTYRVEKLNELTDEANRLLNKDRFNKEAFWQIIREAYLLVTDEEPFFEL